MFSVRNHELSSVFVFLLARLNPVSVVDRDGSIFIRANSGLEVEISELQIRVLLSINEVSTWDPVFDVQLKFVEEFVDHLDDWVLCKTSPSSPSAKIEEELATRDPGGFLLCLRRWVFTEVDIWYLFDFGGDDRTKSSDRKTQVVVAVLTLVRDLDSFGLDYYFANDSADSASFVLQFFRESACVDLEKCFGRILSLFGSVYPEKSRSRAEKIDDDLRELLVEQEEEFGELLEQASIEVQLQSYLNDPFVRSDDGLRVDNDFNGYRPPHSVEFALFSEKKLRETTHQWAESFPELQLSRPGQLLRICGPLVQGIELVECVHPQGAYRPRAFLYVLLGKDIELSTGVGHPIGLEFGFVPETGTLDSDDHETHQCINRFRSGLRLGFESPLSVRSVLDCYVELVESVGPLAHLRLVSEPVLLAIWTGNQKVARDMIDWGLGLTNARGYRLFPSARHADGWSKQMRMYLDDPASLREEYEYLIKEHRLRRFDRQELDCSLLAEN